MTIQSINECVSYFLHSVADFMTTPFGLYFCGAFVSIICLNLVLRLTSLSNKSYERRIL